MLRRVRADPGGVCGPHLALEFEESDFLSCTPCTPEGAADASAPRTPPVTGFGYPFDVGGLRAARRWRRFVFSHGLGHNNVVDRFWVPWGRQAAHGPSKEVWAGKKWRP